MGYVNVEDCGHDADAYYNFDYGIYHDASDS